MKDMPDWEQVVQNKVLLTKVEELVNEVADTYYDFPEDICQELNRLTGNEWSGETYLEYCAGFWESPWSLEEVVFALFHAGKFPDKKEEDVYAWNIEHSIETDEEVVSFFRFGQYREEPEKCSKYEDVNLKQLYGELKDVLSTWDDNSEEWEDDSYDRFYCSDMEIYGYEKVVDIYCGYEQKFLNCTFTNISETEKAVLLEIVGKYCNHIVWDAE